MRQLNTAHQQTLYIFDSRPQINAVGNSLMGKGYEAPSVYRNCRLVFLNIDNIQVPSSHTHTHIPYYPVCAVLTVHR